MDQLRRSKRLCLRGLYAAFVSAIFIANIFASWTLGFAVIILLLTVISISVFTDRRESVKFFNTTLIRPTMRTNNRWWVCMAGMVIISGVVWIGTWAIFGMGSPTGGRHPTEIMSNQSTSLMDQRMANLQKSGRFASNEELGLGGQVEQVSILSNDRQDPTREAWIFRLRGIFILLILLLLYSFFAFSDEVKDTWYAAKAKVTGVTEGTSIPTTAVQAAIATAVPVAAAAVTKSAGIGFGRLLGIDILSEFITGFASRIIRGAR